MVVYIDDFVSQAGVRATEDPGGSAAAQMQWVLGEATRSSPDGSKTDFQKQLVAHIDKTAKGFTASGQATASYTSPVEPPMQGSSNLQVQFTLTSGEPPEQVEAIIIPKSDYKSWLPQAGTSPGKAGNRIVFDVELRDTITGQKAKDKTAEFECLLENTSSYPGSCMNSPWDDTQPDLKFDKSDNPGMASISADGQTARSKPKQTSCTISVSCLDGAARAELEIIAHIDGKDEQITAHLDKTDLGSVHLPYDADESGIADAWEKDNGVSGKEPDADEDEQPLGDRHQVMV